MAISLRLLVIPVFRYGPQWEAQSELLADSAVDLLSIAFAMALGLMRVFSISPVEV